MRFRQLHLRAFGHFTDRVLEFQAPRPGFHLVYGHNEAGKSTALRAIRGFLFGIPHASGDAFVHASSRLRVGMMLEGEQGETLTLFRRKGRKDTLLDADERPVDESLLAPFLGGIDETLFGAMFGLDHEGLRRGARDLLDSAGSLSESIFGAGAGTRASRDVLAGLRERADELFTERGRGRKRINQEVEEVKRARAAVVEASVSARAYLQQEESLKEAKHELVKRKAERVALDREERRLTRLIALVPSVARLHQVEQHLRELGPVPQLPAEFGQWRAEALRARDEAERDLALYGAEVERAKEKLAALRVSTELLSLDPKLCDDFSDRLGQHRKAERDLPKREGELAALRAQISRMLRELGQPDTLPAAEALLVSKSQEYRFRRLCEEKTRHDTVLEERSLQARDAELEAKQRRKRLAESPVPVETEQLQRSLGRARAQLEKKVNADDFRARALQLELKVERDLAATGRYQGQRSGLLSRSWPDESTLTEYGRRFLRHEERSAQAELGLQEKRAEQLRLEEELRILEAGGDVPAFSELKVLRDARDQLVGDSDGGGAERRVALRSAIASCDTYSDRLVAEAGRVSKKIHLLSALTKQHKLIEDLRARAAKEAAESAGLHAQWEALWSASGVTPGAPAEMRAWLQRVLELRTAEGERKRLSDEARALEADVAGARNELSESLRAVGQPPATMWESLLQLVERAEDTLERLVRERAEHRRLCDEERRAVSEAEDAVRRLEELKESYKLWRGDWQKALKLLGLRKEASGDEVGAVLEALGDLGRTLEQVRALQGRISGMQRDASQLDDDIRAVAHGLPPADEDASVVSLIERFVSAQRKALGDQAARQRILQDMEQHETAMRRAASLHTKARARLDELMGLAGAATLEELYQIEERAEQARQLEQQRAALVDDVVTQGEGAELSFVIAEVFALDTEQARARLVELEEDKRPLDAAIEVLVERRTTAENQLSLIDEGANHAAEELAARLARLKRSAGDYIRYRLAATLLEQEVERYRLRHQGPVLTRANEIFPRLTRGRYTSLKPGYDKRDEQILLCVGAGGAEVEIENLSDGTRDQLFLALRLASLQHFLEDRPPLPLVLDDILIHFDDERAAAALEVLSEVAERTQVLFFTHHQRLVELAEKSVAPDRFRVHDLGSGVGSVS